MKNFALLALVCVLAVAAAFLLSLLGGRYSVVVYLGIHLALGLTGFFLGRFAARAKEGAPELRAFVAAGLVFTAALIVAGTVRPQGDPLSLLLSSVIEVVFASVAFALGRISRRKKPGP